MFEPCNSNRSACSGGDSTDPDATAGIGAVTANRAGLDPVGVDKLISRINANCESVSRYQSPGFTSGVPHSASGAVRAKKIN